MSKITRFKNCNFKTQQKLFRKNKRTRPGKQKFFFTARFREKKNKKFKVKNGRAVHCSLTGLLDFCFPPSNIYFSPYNQSSFIVNSNWGWFSRSAKVSLAVCKWINIDIDLCYPPLRVSKDQQLFTSLLLHHNRVADLSALQRHKSQMI